MRKLRTTTLAVVAITLTLCFNLAATPPQQLCQFREQLETHPEVCLTYVGECGTPCCAHRHAAVQYMDCENDFAPTDFYRAAAPTVKHFQKKEATCDPECQEGPWEEDDHTYSYYECKDCGS